MKKTVNNISLKQGIYIEDNNKGYWYASRDQAAAYNNFPIWKYSGMGSSYWYANTKAIENVKGLISTFYMAYNGTYLWLKTSDSVIRHIIKIDCPPLPPN
jgi:hypothetical protein